MKVKIRATIKYGMGRYLHIGEVYDYNDPNLSPETKEVLDSIKGDGRLVQLVEERPLPKPEVVVTEEPVEAQRTGAVLKRRRKGE